MCPLQTWSSPLHRIMPIKLTIQRPVIARRVAAGLQLILPFLVQCAELAVYAHSCVCIK